MPSAVQPWQRRRVLTGAEVAREMIKSGVTALADIADKRLREMRADVWLLRWRFRHLSSDYDSVLISG
jgi:hypothetical protein